MKTTEYVHTRRGSIILRYTPKRRPPSETSTFWLVDSDHRLRGRSPSRAYAIRDAYVSLIRAQETGQNDR